MTMQPLKAHVKNGTSCSTGRRISRGHGGRGGGARRRLQARGARPAASSPRRGRRGIVRGDHVDGFDFIAQLRAVVKLRFGRRAQQQIQEDGAMMVELGPLPSSSQDDWSKPYSTSALSGLPAFAGRPSVAPPSTDPDAPHGGSRLLRHRRRAPLVFVLAVWVAPRGDGAQALRGLTSPVDRHRTVIRHALAPVRRPRGCGAHRRASQYPCTRADPVFTTPRSRPPDPVATAITALALRPVLRARELPGDDAHPGLPGGRVDEPALAVVVAVVSGRVRVAEDHDGLGTVLPEALGRWRARAATGPCAWRRRRRRHPG